MARSRDPPTGDRFQVEVTGFEPFGVSEVGGLEATAEYRDVPLAELFPALADIVGDIAVERLVPVSPHLVLTRAVTDDSVLRGWFDDRLAGRVGPRTVAVALLDTNGLPVARWKCENALPERWVGPRLRTDRSTVAVESLELSHDGVKPA